MTIWQYLGVAVVALVAALVQTTVIPAVAGRGLYVDLFFVIVVIIGLFKDPFHGSIMSVVVGYVEDLCLSGLPGLYMTARLAVFFMAQALKVRINPETPVYRFAVGLGLGVADRIIIAVLYYVFAEPLFFSGREALLMATGVLVNAALAPFAYYGFLWIPGFIEVPRGPRARG